MYHQHRRVGVQQHIFGDAVVQEIIPEGPLVGHKNEQVDAVFKSVFVQAFHDIFAHYFAKNKGHLRVGIHVVNFKQFFLQIDAFFAGLADMHKMQLPFKATRESHGLFDRQGVQRIEITGIQDVLKPGVRGMRRHQ